MLNHFQFPDGYMSIWPEYVYRTPYILRPTPEMFRAMMAREVVREKVADIANNIKKERIIPFFYKDDDIIMALVWFEKAYHKHFRKYPYHQYLEYVHEKRHNHIWYSRYYYGGYPPALGVEYL